MKLYAVSDAMIAYQTAYLKANFPYEYMTALLMMVTNSQEVVRQQHLREILGKKEGRKMSFGDIMNCLWVSIVVFLRFCFRYKGESL